MISIPLFAIAFLVTRMDFGVIWRYFGFANQLLATIVLWTAAVYMRKHQRNFWIALLPAAFMTAVCSAYILVAPEGMQWPIGVAYPLSTVVATLAFGYFIRQPALLWIRAKRSH